MARSTASRSLKSSSAAASDRIGRTASLKRSEESVGNLAGRTVFFVKDAERALQHYTEALGFSLDWNHQEDGRAFVFQVSLQGFKLILNQTEPDTGHRAGLGRIFVGIDDDQADAFHQHIAEKGIRTSTIHWGAPTLVIRDLDGNELFFWLPESQRASLEITTAEASPPSLI